MSISIETTSATNDQGNDQCHPFVIDSHWQNDQCHPFVIDSHDRFGILMQGVNFSFLSGSSETTSATHLLLTATAGLVF
ncbi:MAG: hypothetical protein RIK87_07800 [Fuerstiella sp.]